MKNPFRYLALGCILTCGVVAAPHKSWSEPRRLVDNTVDNTHGWGNHAMNLVFSRDGKILITGGVRWANPNRQGSKRAGLIQLWDVATAKLLRTVEGHNDVVQRVLVSPDGTLLATSSQEGTIKLWDFPSMQERRTLAEPDAKAEETASKADQSQQFILRFSGKGVLSLDSFSTDGKTLLGNRRTFDLAAKKWAVSTVAWDVASGELRNEKPAGEELHDRGLLPGSKSQVRVITEYDEKKEHSIGVRIEHRDAGTGALQRTVLHEKGSIYPSAFSPDVTTVALKFMQRGVDGKELRTREIRLYDTRDGKLLQTLTPPQRLSGRLTFSGDGQLVVGSDSEGTLYLWSTRDGQLKRKLVGGNAQAVEQTAFSPDGKTLASLEQGSGRLLLWDLTAPEAPDDGTSSRLVLESGNIRAVAFSPDGKTIMSATGHINWGKLMKGEALEIRTWNAATDEQTSVRIPEERIVQVAVFSPDRKLIAASLGTQPKEVHITGAGVGLYDVENKKLLRTLPGNNFMMDALAFSPDGKTLATGSNEGIVRLWDVETGDAYLTWIPAEKSDVESVAFSPDGKILATGSSNGNIMLWDALSAKHLRTMSEEPPVRRLHFSPDGSTLLSGGYMEKNGKMIGSQAHEWNRTDGAFKQRFSEGNRLLTSIAFSPDGRLLATSTLENWSRSDNGEIKLWDAKTGALLKTIRDVAGADQVVFSPQATRDNITFLTLAGMGKVKLWQVKLPPTTSTIADKKP